MNIIIVIIIMFIIIIIIITGQEPADDADGWDLPGMLVREPGGDFCNHSALRMHGEYMALSFLKCPNIHLFLRPIKDMCF